MGDEAKRAAQEALYAAIRNQAENNMRAALSAPDKAALLHELAAAYRLTAGGAIPDGTGPRERRPGAVDQPRRATPPATRQARETG